MDKKFIVRLKPPNKKENKTITMTIRIDRELQKKYDDLAEKSHRSRNELISMALCYALDNLEFIPDEEESK